MKIKMLSTLFISDITPDLPQRYLIKGQIYTDLSHFIENLVLEKKYGEEIKEEKTEEIKEEKKRRNRNE